MYEKLIENWLINVHELGYQIPFCEVLINGEFTILHVSRHGRGEHGKDIIARDKHGRLFSFQLKQGNITLPVWHSIRGEVDELVNLPASTTLPGLDPSEPHTPVLVTNGELLGDAPRSIESYANVWAARGAGHLETWQKHRLLSMFIDAHGKYLPRELREFRTFVELYVSDFNDRIRRREFAEFLGGLVDSPAVSGRGLKTKRAIESMVLLGSYVIDGFERAANHISSLEGWTIVATTILHVAEREGLKLAHYKPSLALAWEGLDRNVETLRKEIANRNHFVEPTFILGETDFVRGVRTLITLGWLSAGALMSNDHERHIEHEKSVGALLKKFLSSVRLCGEADWPYIACIALLLERDAGASASEGLLERWIESVVSTNEGKDATGVAPPYWLQEKVLALRYNQLAAHEKERFEEHSHTTHSALDMLVRRLCRRFVAQIWPRASRLTLSDYVPDEFSDWFRWQTDRGELRLVIPEQPASWSKWHGEVSQVRKELIPPILLKHPEWILAFVLTYPHRLNRTLMALIDCLVGQRASLI